MQLSNNGGMNVRLWLQAGGVAAVLTLVITASLLLALRYLPLGTALGLGGLSAAVLVACMVLSLGLGEWACRRARTA